MFAEVGSAREWTRACSSAFVPLRVDAAAPDFRASLRQVRLAPGITLAAVTSRASSVMRDAASIATSPREDVLMSFHRRGTGVVTQNGRQARLSPGGCVLYDASTPYTLAFPGQMSEFVLQVPRETIARVGNGFTDLTARVLRPSAPLRALSALVSSVDMAADRRDGAEDELIAESVAPLLRASLELGGVGAEPPIEAELLAMALRLFIDERAMDPELTPAGLAATFHVSLRHVQKVFERYFDTGAAAYIRTRRLEGAQELLRRRCTVAEAAHRSGFLDVDTFSRAFKREFGVTPSGFAAAH
ncbi:helix-turn-helix domain-containing protein [Tsukamurella sp. NPDC003166]|uniref:helix-turn-helix domain-containing protein n=1 Tax=Tsukamurella sp. NPDC003166 TaxID=3154444 RepID=UPI00339E4460